jgi:hypothetical protein
MADEINWNLYETRLNLNGSTQRDRNINYLKNNISNKVINSPSYQSVTINGNSANLVISSVSSGISTRNSLKHKQINSLPDESFMLGDLIVWNSTNWLVIEVDNDDQIYTKGKIEQCNYTLKFQTSNGSIVSCPAIFESKTSMLDENQMISTVDGTAQIKLRFDSDYVNDLVTGKRLMIDARLPDINTPNCYLVIKSVFDSFDGSNGILTLTLKTDEFADAKDNKSNGVCDYFVPSEPVTPNKTLIEFEGEVAQIKQGGSAKSFTVVFPVDNLTPSWTISNIESNYLTYINTVETDNTIKINILDGDDSVINKTFRLNVIGMAGEETTSYSAYLDVKIAPLMGW